MVATATIGSAAIGAGASIFGASKAAKEQKKAAEKASATQAAYYAKMEANMSPYMDMGKQASGMLSNKMGDFTKPIVMDQDALEQTPGYQFTRSQGLKAVQNGAAARGLGSSGAAMKGAATYATGLADSTYQNQFNMENINRTNAYNRLMGMAGAGQSAASGLGGAGVGTGQQIGQNQIGAGNAQAGAYMSMGNSINNFANTVGGYAMSKGMYDGGGTTNNYYGPPGTTYYGNMSNPQQVYGG